MNESFDREINVKWLFYRILRAWRPIVAWGLLIAIVLGAGSFAINVIKRNDPQYQEEAKQHYEYEHAQWAAEEENLKAELTNLEREKDRLTEYNASSIKMTIDPLRQHVASFQVYIKYDYEIIPDMVYQNIDLSNRILKAYEAFLTGGEMYQYLMEHLGYEIKMQYLAEVITVTADYANNFLSVRVIHKSGEESREIAALIQQGLNERLQTVVERIAPHEIVVTNEAAYETVNLSLEKEQSDSLQLLADLNLKIGEVNEELRAWAGKPEPTLGTTLGQIGASAAKLAVIGAVVGVVVAAILVAFGAILSGKLLNPDDMKDRFGVRVVGKLPVARVIKPLAVVSRCFAKIGGIVSTPEDYEKLAALAALDLKSDIEARPEGAQWKSIAFTGTADQELLCRAVEAMGLKGAYHVACAADMLTDPASVQKIVAADCVVLVEQQEKTLHCDIARELEALAAWNKPVLGAVILNTDAIM